MSPSPSRTFIDNPLRQISLALVLLWGLASWAAPVEHDRSESQNSHSFAPIEHTAFASGNELLRLASGYAYEGEDESTWLTQNTGPTLQSKAASLSNAPTLSAPPKRFQLPTPRGPPLA